MITYLDSSVILDHVLDGPASRPIWDQIERAVSSILTEVECLRALDRLRVLNMLDETTLVHGREVLFRVLESCELMAIGRAVLDRAAAPYPMAIKTLDAIHLASALLYRETTGPIRMATTDRALSRAARAMGFEVLGVA